MNRRDLFIGAASAAVAGVAAVALGTKAARRIGFPIEMGMGFEPRIALPGTGRPIALTGLVLAKFGATRFYWHGYRPYLISAHQDLSIWMRQSVRGQVWENDVRLWPSGEKLNFDVYQWRYANFEHLN